MTVEILEEIAVLGTKAGWNKELNFVRWDGKWDRYDIRSWTPDHVSMSKGISLTREEFLNLKLVLECYEIG